MKGKKTWRNEKERSRKRHRRLKEKKTAGQRQEYTRWEPRLQGMTAAQGFDRDHVCERVKGGGVSMNGSQQETVKTRGKQEKNRGM